MAVFDETEAPGAVPSLRLLLTGLDNAYRLDFSADGRFLIVETFPSQNGQTQQVGVWDLSGDWLHTLAGESGTQLEAQACAAAAIERPDGAAFTREERITWIGPKGVQPCSRYGRGSDVRQKP
jgi:hypothetical protein